MTVVWSNHAVQRAEERFGFHDSITIPNHKIKRAAAKAAMGVEFRVREMLATFVCKKVNRETVIILTVLYTLGK